MRHAQRHLRDPCIATEDMPVARMIPEAPLDTESNAERRLFERLRDETPDEIVAFHSVAWQLPGKNGRPEQGEADFVLAHQDFGVLTLEVKGGTVRYDAQAGKWFTTGKKGESQIKDPGRQARSSSHALGRALARASRGGGETISFGHAVAFPDCRVPKKTLRQDLPRELVLDHADIVHLPDRIDGLFRHWYDADNKAPLGSEGIDRLERLLANSFELRAPLAFELAEEQRRLYRLTEEQYRVLDMLSRQTRVAIAGCAGSGKTFLAAEKARRMAAQGFHVLVVVFNRPTARGDPAKARGHRAHAVQLRTQAQTGGLTPSYVGVSPGCRPVSGPFTSPSAVPPLGRWRASTMRLVHERGLNRR
jgi:Nuclease-related domain/PhoH-like protein